MKKPSDRAPSAAHLLDFLATTKRLDRERQAAAGTVDRLLRDTPKAAWPILAEHPDLQTYGSLEWLANLIADDVTRDPQHAHALAELAVSLAEALPLHSYPPVIVAQIRAHAYKDLSTSLRFLGRNPEALEALARAEIYLEDHGTLAHDRAIIRFSLAVTLQELHRPTESMQLLIECKKVFRAYRDDRRFMLCGFAEAALQQRLGKFREAREAYLLLLTAQAISTEDLAAIHKAIGFCSIELGDFMESENNLNHALTLYHQLGQPIEILNTEAGRGRLYIRRGDIELGIGHLRPIRRAFLQHAMTEEAGLCALDIIEGMLVRGKASEAEQLARLVIHEFTSAGFNTRAIMALGYLREALASKSATVALAKGVHQYLLSLRTEPEREFSPRF
jgi:tetratricopeptide (TPR) repeat protein